ncbi:MAG: Uma2 family endonuclease [Actinomycetota bacterium]|nr:Uma2 family endonuclease [Actinomycetota bacterium]
MESDNLGVRSYTDGMALAVPAGVPLTYEDLQSFPDDGRRYEIIDGTLIVTPAPAGPHQVVVGALYRVLFAGRRPGTSVLAAPMDFVPNPTTVLQPDVVVIDAEEALQPYLSRTPHLVVEVLSPSTRSQDLGSKLLAYAETGVPAYWIVDPEPPVTLQAFHLQGAAYQLVARVVGDERFEPVVPFSVSIVPSHLREL